MTIHVLQPNLRHFSKSQVNTVGPLSTSSMSMSRHVVPRTQPRCSPSRRGKLYPSPQVEESPSTVTPRSRQMPPARHNTALLSQSAPDQTAHGPLTVSHDASIRHSKRASIHPHVARAL